MALTLSPAVLATELRESSFSGALTLYTIKSNNSNYQGDTVWPRMNIS